MTETLLFCNGYGYSLFHFRQIFIGKSDLCSSIIAERPEILWDFAASTEKHAYTGIKMQILLLPHCLARNIHCTFSLRLSLLYSAEKLSRLFDIRGDARMAALPPCSAGQSPVGAVPAPCIPSLPVKMLLEYQICENHNGRPCIPSLPVKMLHRCLLHKVGIRLPAVRIHLFRCLYFSIGSAPLQSHGAGMRKRIARIYHFQL